jgi:hypothetical protein
MTTETAHAQHTRPGRRGAYRLGLLASACLGAVGLAAGAAQAIAGVGVADTSAHALANPAHPDVFKDSFEVHQLGAVLAASARNQAQAQSVQCTAERPCRSVSLSFQIVTMTGDQAHLNPVNLSNAQNVHCPGCESLAIAYQFIVSTDDPSGLGPAAQQELGRIHDELNALSSSNASAAQLRDDVDALAGRVTSILKSAPIATPMTTHAANQSRGPLVTVHRMVDQH